ncbi:aldehyde dehydrogenase, partial [Striga asiatica]
SCFCLCFGGIDFVAEKLKGFIVGKWTNAYDGKTIEVQNSATGNDITNVLCIGRRETNNAVASTHDAFPCKGIRAGIPVALSGVLFVDNVAITICLSSDV